MDWLDEVETGWTDQHFTGLEQTSRTKTPTLPRWESRVRRSRRQREKMAIDVICTRTSSTATDGMGRSTNERACPARSPVSEALVSLWEMSQSRFMPRFYSFPIFRCSSVAACAIETHVAPRLSTRDKRTL